MKVGLRYTIIQESDDDTDNWEDDVTTPEQLLERVKEYIKDDMSYVLDSLDDFVVNVELVKEEENKANADH